MAFAGRVAIVTGGASGIGRELCKQLASKGAKVAVADIDGDRAAEVASSLDGASSHRVDVCDADAVQALVSEVAGRHGALDFMFNNAGIAIIGEVIDTPLESWYRVLDVNVRGVVHGVAAAYPLMVEQGTGHIVNTASIAGLIPAPGLTAYGATKHAVVGLSKGLRVEAAQYGVRVSAVCPGFVKTAIVDHATTHGVDRERAERAVPTWADVGSCARDILRGVARNQGIIVVTGHGKQLERLHRFAPRALSWLMSKGLPRSLGRS